MPFDLACVAHVHSTYSDGTAAVPEILAAARAAGAGAVLLTDHDTLGAREDGWEGWHDGVLLVVGMEVSPKAGHLLVFGVDEVVGHEERDEAAILADVARQGGMAIAAHPFSQGSRMSRTIAPPHPWGALEDERCHGLELWSMTTDVAEAWPSPAAAVRELRAPEALDGPPARNLAAWDALLERRRMVAIGGLDAHQPGLRLRGRVRSIQPHARWFALLRTHVLLDEAPRGDTADAARVLEALRAGRCYLALDHLADPAGFGFTAGEAAVGMGGEVPVGGELAVRVPHEARLRVLRGGTAVAETTGTELRAPVREPGAHRAEAWLGGRRWILSNPIYAVARASRAGARRLNPRRA